MLEGALNFVVYLATAIALLAAFLAIYVNVTPYREFALIGQGNVAAAITLAGATLGFTFPLVASIYYTQSLGEMAVWAAITCVVQLAVFLVMRRYAKRIEEGNVAPAVFIASLSIAVGLLNAVSISH